MQALANPRDWSQEYASATMRRVLRPMLLLRKMTTRIPRAALYILIATSLAACGARNKPAGDTMPKTCNIDTAKICAEVSKTLVMTPVMQAQERLTRNVYAPVTVPENGASFTIRCQIDVESKAVLGSSVLSDADMTESAAEYFRSKGYCAAAK
ncbi:MAG TPA: hypothetical protein VMA09_24165 [Candidatus Binataceae bacterium]|nr:hypothetical protein [Candidatus Binataceae bacterium]